MYLAELFESPPNRWGLRGDPYLWKAMKAMFETTPLPESEEQLEEILRSAFKSLTGKSVDYSKRVRIEEFDHGGMSGGMVDPAWWKSTGIPCIVERWENRF